MEPHHNQRGGKLQQDSLLPYLVKGLKLWMIHPDRIFGLKLHKAAINTMRKRPYSKFRKRPDSFWTLRRANLVSIEDLFSKVVEIVYAQSRTVFYFTLIFNYVQTARALKVWHKSWEQNMFIFFSLFSVKSQRPFFLLLYSLRRWHLQG